MPMPKESPCAILLRSTPLRKCISRVVSVARDHTDAPKFDVASKWHHHTSNTPCFDHAANKRHLDAMRMFLFKVIHTPRNLVP
jgi:hypothetical protein